MKVLPFLSLLFVIKICNAGILEEMEALDKEIEEEHKRTIKSKALKDMSTDELIEELKREVHKFNQPSAKHQKKFDAIIEKYKKEKETGEYLDQILTSAKRGKSIDERDNFYERAIDKMLEQMDKNDDACSDNRLDCGELINKKKISCTGQYKDAMEKRCAKSCGFCKPKIECKDKISTERCKMFRDINYCDTDNKDLRRRTIKLCPFTCGACRVEAPPKCSNSLFGCCWDKETTKEDAEGKSCPVCKDQYRSACKVFSVDCPSLNIAGDFMNHHCPVTCNRCNANGCFDSALKGHLCRVWKELNWCENKELSLSMKHHCPKTCGYC